MRRPTSFRSSGSAARRPQPRIALAENAVAAGLEHVAVRDDDAVEVPGEDLLEALARRVAVADQQRIELRGAELAVAADQPHEPARGRRGARAEVEREVA